MKPTLESFPQLSTILEVARCSSACSRYCFTDQIVFGNARRLCEGSLDRYIHWKAGEPEGRVKQFDSRGLQKVGVFMFLLLVRECVGKGEHVWERTATCGDLWKDRRRALL